jgi:DNA-binding Xre family transcriptional regulator
MNELKKALDKRERSVLWLSRKTGIDQTRLHRLVNMDNVKFIQSIKLIEAQKIEIYIPINEKLKEVL